MGSQINARDHPLQQHVIHSHLLSTERELLASLDVRESIDSTNRQLMDDARTGAASGAACVAAEQTAGRGRRGRRWQSPNGNVYLSVLWRFVDERHPFGSLSLAIAVGLARAVQQLGVEQVALKWPNDLQWQGRKLAGILLESGRGGNRDWYVVAGMGLNVRMQRNCADSIAQPWVDLKEILGSPLDRNQVAARMLANTLRVFDEFSRDGFQPFRADWERWDCMSGRQVVLISTDSKRDGWADGVDEHGLLLFRTPAGVEHICSGDISIRSMP